MEKVSLSREANTQSQKLLSFIKMAEKHGGIPTVFNKSPFGILVLAIIFYLENLCNTSFVFDLSSEILKSFLFNFIYRSRSIQSITLITLFTSKLWN